MKIRIPLITVLSAFVIGSFLAADAEAYQIKRVIRAGIKANRYIKSNRDGTIQFLMEWLRLNREIATATYDSVVRVYDDDINLCDKGLRLVIDETKKTMKLSRDVSYSEIADLSILREAQRELGIKQE